VDELGVILVYFFHPCFSMLKYHLADEQEAHWWPQFRDVVSPHRHDHQHQLLRVFLSMFYDHNKINIYFNMLFCVTFLLVGRITCRCAGNISHNVMHMRGAWGDWPAHSALRTPCWQIKLNAVYHICDMFRWFPELGQKQLEHTQRSLLGWSWLNRIFFICIGYFYSVQSIPCTATIF
jgi:hypothetical protein